MVEMSIPTLQMIGFGPPVDKRGKPTGPIAVESDRRSWATIRNYWYAQNEWHHELLFYIGNMFDHLRDRRAIVDHRVSYPLWRPSRENPTRPT